MIAFLLQAQPGDLGSMPGIGLTGIAGVMFWFYRQDRKDSQERHRACEERLESHFQEMRTIVQDNTKAMQSVVDAVEHLKQ